MVYFDKIIKYNPERIILWNESYRGIINTKDRKPKSRENLGYLTVALVQGHQNTSAVDITKPEHYQALKEYINQTGIINMKIFDIEKINSDIFKGKRKEVPNKTIDDLFKQKYKNFKNIGVNCR